MGLVLIDRFLSWSTPSTRGCKSSRSELWPFWPLNTNRFIINVQVTSLRPRKTFQKLSKHVSHLLKWTTILITAGFPVTMSCIWSTFELHNKQTNIWFPQYVSLTWLVKGYNTIHRPTEDLREHKYTYPSPTTLKIRIASFSRPFFRVGNCVRVTYNTKTAKIELLQRYNNYYKGLCPCYPF